MDQIKILIRQRDNLNGEQLKKIDSQILNLLSNYYQIMINAHPFVRINHSLFMNQVNLVLVELGKKSLPHAEMDWLAMILDSKQFRMLFYETD